MRTLRTCNDRAYRHALVTALALAVVFTFTSASSAMLVIAVPASRPERIAFTLLNAAAAACLWVVWALIRRIPED